MGLKEYHLFSSNSISDKQVSFNICGSIYAAYCRIARAVIPLSWSTTHYGNNTIAFVLNGTTYKARIKEGNHNVSTMPDAIKNALTTAAPNGWNVTFDTITRRLTITGTTAFTLLPFDSGNGSTAYRTIGLEKFQTRTGTNVELKTGDFTNNSPILVTSSTLTTHNSSFSGEDQINLLTSIPTTSPVGSFIDYQNVNPTKPQLTQCQCDSSTHTRLRRVMYGIWQQ